MSGYSIPVNPLVFNLRSRPQNWSPSAGSPHGTDTLLQVYCIFRLYHVYGCYFYLHHSFVARLHQVSVVHYKKALNKVMLSMIFK